MRAYAAPDTQALRGWQRRALVRYLGAKPRDFLAVATPGAGKTAFALRVAGELLADGTDWKTTGQNDFLYVPPGGIHGFRNEADEPASMLMLFAPGAPREHYFEGFAHLSDMTDEERREWFIKNDNFFVD